MCCKWTANDMLQPGSIAVYIFRTSAMVSTQADRWYYYAGEALHCNTRTTRDSYMRPDL